MLNVNMDTPENIYMCHVICQNLTLRS